jgi:hypothetical protein
VSASQRLRLLAIVLLGLAGGAPRAAATPAARPATPAPTADASVLYNAGTAALERGEPGPAVAFLLAAERLDARAADVRRNLAEARARAAAARGAEEPGESPAPLPLAPREAWWLSCALLGAGALLASAPRVVGGGGRRVVRALSVSGHAALAGGILLAAWLALRAREEAVHPEAVVLAPTLPVGPAPDERPRPPYLLGAGEVVRLGRTRGGLIEIRVSGTAIGWADRSGVWRVIDAARYTSRFSGS